MKYRNKELEMNQNSTTVEVFMELYNKSIPAGFPRATLLALEQFRATHPLLFKRGDAWLIDRHRKRFMDWLSSLRNAS